MELGGKFQSALSRPPFPQVPSVYFLEFRTVIIQSGHLGRVQWSGMHRYAAVHVLQPRHQSILFTIVRCPFGLTDSMGTSLTEPPEVWGGSLTYYLPETGACNRTYPTLCDPRSEIHDASVSTTTTRLVSLGHRGSKFGSWTRNRAHVLDYLGD